MRARHPMNPADHVDSEPNQKEGIALEKLEDSD